MNIELSKPSHVNVNSTDEMRHLSDNEVPAKTFGLHAISLAEISPEKTNSLTSKEPRFATENHEVHGHQDHRNVNLQTDETLLGSLNNNRNSAESESESENENANNIKHKRENIVANLIKRGVRWLTDRVVGLFTSAFRPLYENGFNGFDWQPTLENTAVTVAAICSPLFRKAYFLKKTGALVIVLNSISTVGAKPVVNVIDIDNANMLKMIGVSAAYPSNGHYRLTANIDASNITQPIPKLLGTLDGQGYTISNLSCCLIQVMEGDALVINLIVRGANTGLSSCTATITSTLSDQATINSIQVLDSQVKQHIHTPHVGIIANYILDSSRIEHSLILNCSIISTIRHSNCGGVAGGMWGGAGSINNTISKSNITALGDSAAVGGVTGVAEQDVVINQSSINQVNVIAHGNSSKVALIAGLVNVDAKINGATLINSMIQALGDNSWGGFAVGSLELGPPFLQISNTFAICCRFIIAATDSTAYLWVGHSSDEATIQINNSRAININCTFDDVDQRTVTQSTTTEPVTQPTITAQPTMVAQPTITAQPTMAAQPTIAAPVPVEDISLIPILLGGGCIIAGVTTTVLVSYSIYSGHKQGKRGWELFKHPGKSCLEWFMKVGHFGSYRLVQSERTGIEVTGADGATEIEMSPSSEMSMQWREDTVGLMTEIRVSASKRYGVS
ncbi:MAG: hypothetical protein KAG53_01950 [Endozoicomonadaceae bacterium]|nr:hypothetical protein [Endozoicomonadaceae bacterium]